MTDHIAMTRRGALTLAGALLPWPALAAAPEDALKALEASSRARIGVAAVDTGSGRAIFWRSGERFVMCSSFKLSLAAAVLSRIDTGQEPAGQVVHYSQAQLMPVSPATSKHVAAGMTLEALCEAAVIFSDNTAANLLLAHLGGPSAVTAYWRSLGDQTSRLDDIEPVLNIPNGARNTTTPVAMLANLRSMLLGDALNPATRARLLAWMHASTTGSAMLRAGLPKNWTVGDKTGRYVEGAYNAAIDLAIATPPSSNGKNRAPVLVAAFTMNGQGDDAAHQSLLADIGRVVGGAFA